MVIVNDGHKIGEKDTNILLRKHKPKLTNTLVKRVQISLREKLKTKYKNKPEAWKIDYGSGAMEEL